MKSSKVKVSDEVRSVDKVKGARLLNKVNCPTSKEYLQKRLGIWGQLKRSWMDRDENKSGQKQNGEGNDEYK
jgi:hypothetical protein